MPRLLLLLPSTTYRAEAFLDAARKLGVDVTLGLERTAILLDRPHYDCLSLNFGELQRSAAAVVEYAQKQAIHAVLGVDDATAVMAAEIASALNLPHNSVESVSAARNKYRMRQLLRDHGVNVPRFTRFSIFDDPEALAGKIAFPCVVKPLLLSASCGVIRANDSLEFVAAFRRVTSLLRALGMDKVSEAGRQLLVESFVPGHEVALEGLLTAGSLRVLALFDKPDPLDGPFFEKTLYVTPSRLPASSQEKIASCAQRAASALGLQEGPIHGELRVNDDGVWVIELAARSIGGRCSGSLRFASDLSLEEIILRQAFRMNLPAIERAVGVAGVMMLPIPRAGMLREVRGRENALALAGIEEVTITAKIGDELVPLPEGTRYLGFMIARADTPADAEATLRAAHTRLEFIIEEREGTRAKEAGSDGRVRSIRF